MRREKSETAAETAQNTYREQSRAQSLIWWLYPAD